MRHTKRVTGKKKYTKTDRQENRLHTNSERCPQRLTDRKTADIKTMTDVHRD